MITRSKPMAFYTLTIVSRIPAILTSQINCLGMSPLPQNIIDEIKELISQKLSYRAIASEVCVSVGSVSKI